MKKMRKQLSLIRHAKSSWDNTHLPDYERTLNERGQQDAISMGKALRERKIKFEQILCSSAKRARETLALLCGQLEIEDNTPDYLDDLYCASVATLIEIIQQLDNSKNNITIVAHNPGLEDLAAILSNKNESFSTCTVMQIEFEIDNWHQIGKVTGKQTMILNPKNL